MVEKPLSHNEILDLRRQRYKKFRIKGMNRYNAAIAAGYSPSYAKSRSYKIDLSEKVGMVDYYERAGITNKALAEVNAAGLEAMHGLNGKFPDWMARHKWFITALEMKGIAPDPKVNNETSEALHLRVLNIINNYNYNITVEDKDKPKVAEEVIDVKIEPADFQVRDGVKIA